jgi:SAM-dependent methyltransferase
MDLKTLLKGLPNGGMVLDVGCLGFAVHALGARVGRGDLRHAGVDYSEPDAVPSGFDYRPANLNKQTLPFPDDYFDLVVASHVIEHLDDPVAFFGDCARVCRPGGKIYVACPSERALWLPGFPFQHDKFYSLSFFDDPTHARRPFSAQSLYRLARYWGCEVVEADYQYEWKYRLAFPFVVPFAWLFRVGWLLETVVWRAVGWASYAVATKPKDVRGLPEFRYYVPAGRAEDGLKRVMRRALRR